MAKAAFTKGRCHLCGAEYTHAGMSKHIVTCAPRYFAERPSAKGTVKPVFVLSIAGAPQSEYWMHIAAPGTATLHQMDRFLREIWLECCGHLSQFIIDDKIYTIHPNTRRGRSTRTQLHEVLEDKMEFWHEYDMGNTTTLKLKVLATFTAQLDKDDILLLARNEPPERLCEQCGQPAQFVCTECLWKGLGWLCKQCAKKHECGEDMLLPVVNSPRVGICGYTGGAEWDWEEEES
jgi:hypothetical protein